MLSRLRDLREALRMYVADNGNSPGEGYPEGANAFPALFEALFGERPPEGKGGPNAPYLHLWEHDVRVHDRDEGGFRPVFAEEIRDPKVEKYLADPWDHPLIYRLIRDPQKQAEGGKAFLLYSTGPDGIDDIARGDRGDDIEAGDGDVRPGISLATIAVLLLIPAIGAAAILLLGRRRGALPERPAA
jgi:hypothetical protein